ncbi:MAG: HepT-like ribonuclease domain-containing protein [Chitinophagales bacterium]
MRNIAVHEYFGIDFEIIWQIVNVDLPIFKKEIEKFL